MGANDGGGPHCHGLAGGKARADGRTGIVKQDQSQWPAEDSSSGVDDIDGKSGHVDKRFVVGGGDAGFCKNRGNKDWF